LPQDELARLTGGLHFPYRQLILHASRGFRGDACDAPVSCQSTRVERGRRTREAGVPGTPEMPRVTTDRTVPGGRCHLLESGESLRGLWIARYLPSGKERKRVHGVHRRSEGLSARRREPESWGDRGMNRSSTRPAARSELSSHYR